MPRQGEETSTASTWSIQGKLQTTRSFPQVRRSSVVVSMRGYKSLSRSTTNTVSVTIAEMFEEVYVENCIKRGHSMSIYENCDGEVERKVNIFKNVCDYIVISFESKGQFKKKQAHLQLT